jgi:hypothetical protein
MGGIIRKKMVYELGAQTQNFSFLENSFTSQMLLGIQQQRVAHHAIVDFISSVMSSRAVTCEKVCSVALHRFFKSN